MRHRARARKLGRTSAHRLAMYRNMVTSLLEHERIETTDAKAKEVRRLADRMITLGKRGDLHARRRALRVIRRREVAAKVFDELADRYRDRPGGYTRLLKLRRRLGDAALLSVVELVSEPAPEKATKRGRAGERPQAEAGGRKAAKKARAAKAPAAKKAAAKKTGAKKTPSKKTPAKKTASKKAGTRSASAEKATSKKAATRKSPRKKSD
jgi:large subunit ribosomal protein L17